MVPPARLPFGWRGEFGVAAVPAGTGTAGRMARAVSLLAGRVCRARATPVLCRTGSAGNGDESAAGTSSLPAPLPRYGRAVGHGTAVGWLGGSQGIGTCRVCSLAVPCHTMLCHMGQCDATPCQPMPCCSGPTSSTAVLQGTARDPRQGHPRVTVSLCRPAAPAAPAEAVAWLTPLLTTDTVVVCRRSRAPQGEPGAGGEPSTLGEGPGTHGAGEGAGCRGSAGAGRGRRRRAGP